MAKLSGHGDILYRISFPNYDEVLTSDGTFLRNYGWGWKVHAKVKKGLSPDEAANRVMAWYKSSKPPEFHDYVRALKDAVGLKDRWRMHELIKLMPDDPDGIWGELCDHNIRVEFPDVDNAARAYKDYMRALQSQSQASAE